MINKSLRCCIAFLLASLIACSTTTGPVIIRDSQPLNIEAYPETKNKNITVTQPVTPDKQSKSIPLVEKLVSQSSQALANQRYTKAVNLAERGLRINRKDARFYLVLARAYHHLNNKKQSVYFAKQGLRYANKNSPEYSNLNTLAR